MNAHLSRMTLKIVTYCDHWISRWWQEGVWGNIGTVTPWKMLWTLTGFQKSYMLAKVPSSLVIFPFDLPRWISTWVFFPVVIQDQCLCPPHLRQLRERYSSKWWSLILTHHYSRLWEIVRFWFCLIIQNLSWETWETWETLGRLEFWFQLTLINCNTFIDSFII